MSILYINYFHPIVKQWFAKEPEQLGPQKKFDHHPPRRISPSPPPSSPPSSFRFSLPRASVEYPRTRELGKFCLKATNKKSPEKARKKRRRSNERTKERKEGRKKGRKKPHIYYMYVLLNGRAILVL